MLMNDCRVFEQLERFRSIENELSWFLAIRQVIYAARNRQLENVVDDRRHRVVVFDEHASVDDDKHDRESMD